ncbi:hypothetical protein BKA57DRAFT_16270 [Linnemannia elongata]|nr:hypothetical protein BKA57DRAFT_16270 [Linnemannia elongata]
MLLIAWRPLLTFVCLPRLLALFVRKHYSCVGQLAVAMGSSRGGDKCLYVCLMLMSWLNILVKVQFRPSFPFLFQEAQISFAHIVSFQYTKLFFFFFLWPLPSLSLLHLPHFSCSLFPFFPTFAPPFSLSLYLSQSFLFLILFFSVVFFSFLFFALLLFSSHCHRLPHIILPFSPRIPISFFYSLI